MAVAVQRDLVPGVDDLARERGIAQHLLADEEERRAHPLAREDLEHRWRSLRVWAVVERERVAASTRRCGPPSPSGGRRPRHAPASPGSR